MTGQLDEGVLTSQHETVSQLPELAERVRDLIVTSARVVVLTHGNPDADAVGSALGIQKLCRELGNQPVLTATGDAALPQNLEFLPGASSLKVVDDAAIVDSDLLILVDCSDPARLGPLFQRLDSEFKRERPVINIDHHVTNHRFGTLNVVVPESASTAEIVVGIFGALGIDVDSELATILLAGVYGDTLGLRTPSTSPETMRACAKLVEAGANLDTIVDHLFRLKPYSTVCLWGDALQRTQWRGALIWTQVDPAMLERAGAQPHEAEGIVNFLAGTIGARAAALLYEESWGWRVSMRTLAHDIDVAELLKRHNGGGHPRAAGAKLPPGPDARDAFLDDIAAHLGPVDQRLPAIASDDDRR